MGSKIPHTIKLQVMERLISGFSRDDIAFSIGISTGAVSNIINDYRKGEIKDIDFLRSVAVKMKQQGLTPSDVGYSIRLRNMLDMLELPEERVEKLLQALSIYNYKNDLKDPEVFIDEIVKVSDYVTRLELSVFDIVEYIEKMKTKLKKLDLKILVAKMKLGGLEYQQNEVRSNIKKLNASKTFENNESN